MALSLEDGETDHLARQLAQRTGESLTTAVRQALNDKLDRLNAEEDARIAARLAGVRETLDCFAYTLARSRGEALLLKGDDFSRTDATVAA